MFLIQVRGYKTSLWRGESFFDLEIPAYGPRGNSINACNAARPAEYKMAVGGPKMAGKFWKGLYH